MRSVVDGTDKDGSSGLGERKYTLQKLINYLNTQKIDRMKSEFECGVNEELTLVEFVRMGLRNFQVDEVDELEFVECLCEFFSEVDTEQTGRIRFSAFTDFIINFAMPESLGSGFDAVAPPRFEVVPQEDAHCHHNGIEFLKSSQSLNAVMTCERGFCGVRLWTQTLLPQEQKALVWSKIEKKLVCNLVPIEEDDSAVGAYALACDFDPQNRMVGCALSTSRLCWWDSLHRCFHSEHCDLLQTGMWYSSLLGQWLSSGVDGVVRLWQPRSLFGIAKGRLIGHQDKVTTMTDINSSSIPSTIATGSLDKVVLLWDVTTLSQTAKIVDFKQGVRDLDYHQEYNVICAGGLELCGRILTPQPTSLHATIATLTPHSSPLIACRAVPNSPAVVTADELNFIRLWDLRKTSSPYQVIRPDQINHEFDHLCVVRDHEDSGDRYGLILAGGTMQGLRGPQIPHAISSKRRQGSSTVDHTTEHTGRFVACALKLPQLIVVVMSLEIQVWSALTGQLVRRLQKLVGEYEEISAFCFDSRQACFFLGYDRGALRQYVFSTGMPSNPAELTRHEAPVTHVQYVPNPQYLVVSASADGVVQVHRGDVDYALLRVLRPMDFDARISTFSGSQLSLFLGGHSLSFWNIEVGKCTKVAPTGTVELDPNAFKAVTTGDLHVEMPLDNAELTAAAFLGPLAAMVTVDDQQRIEVWSVEHANCLARIFHKVHDEDDVTINQVVPIVQWPEAQSGSRSHEDVKFMKEAGQAMRLRHPSPAWLRHRRFLDRLEGFKAKAAAFKEDSGGEADELLENVREELLELTQEAMLMQYSGFWGDVGEDAAEAFRDLRLQLDMQLSVSMTDMLRSGGEHVETPSTPARNKGHGQQRMSLLGSSKRIQALDRALIMSHDKSNADDSPRDTSPDGRDERFRSGGDSSDFQSAPEPSAGASGSLPVVWIIVGDSKGFITVYDASAIIIGARLHERPTPPEKLNLNFKKMPLSSPECPPHADEDEALPELVKLHSWRAHRKPIAFTAAAQSFGGLITLSEDWSIKLWSLGAIDEPGTHWGTLDLRRLVPMGDWSPPEVLVNSSLHLVQAHRVMLALHGEEGCKVKEKALRMDCLEQIRLGNLMQEFGCDSWQKSREDEIERDNGPRANASGEKGVMHRGKRLLQPIAGVNLVEAMANATGERLSTPKSLQTRTIHAELTHQPPLPSSVAYTGASRKLEQQLDKIEREFDQNRMEKGKRRCYSPRPKHETDRFHGHAGIALSSIRQKKQTMVSTAIMMKSKKKEDHESGDDRKHPRGASAPGARSKEDQLMPKTKLDSVRATKCWRAFAQTLDKGPEEFHSTYAKMLAQSPIPPNGDFGGTSSPAHQSTFSNRPGTAPSREMSERKGARDAAGVSMTGSRSSPEFSSHNQTRRPESASSILNQRTGSPQDSRKAVGAPDFSTKAPSRKQAADGTRRLAAPMESRHGQLVTDSVRVAKRRTTHKDGPTSSPGLSPKMPASPAQSQYENQLNKAASVGVSLDVSCFRGETERLLNNCTRTLANRFAAELAGKDNASIRQAQRREGIWMEISKLHGKNCERT
jgi:WD40 repeat protein